MKSKQTRAIVGGLLTVVLLGSSWVQGAAEGPAIKLQVADNAIQVVTDADAPSYYLEYRTPTGTWQKWNADLQLENAEALWFRAVFESGDIMTWEPPADATTFYSPSTVASTTDGRVATTVGTFTESGSLVSLRDVDWMSDAVSAVPPIANDIPDPANNQAYATPMAGTSQLIWRRPTTGVISRWDLADVATSNFVIRAYDRFRLLPDLGEVSLDANWVLSCIAALDSDGILNDYVWQNTSNGRFSLWRVNEDPTIGEFGPIEYEVSPGVWENVSLPSPWTVVGVASLDPDGVKNDIIWHNPVSGVVSRWEIGADGRIAQFGRIQYNPGSGYTDVELASPWTLGAIAALEDDGLLNDFIWQNPSTGRFSYWKVNATAQITEYGPVTYDNGTGIVDANLKSPWTIVGVGEIDGDNKLNDVIWHHPTLGYVSRWDVGPNGLVNAFGRIQYEVSGEWQPITLRSPWSMRGVVSLDGDNKLNDLVWHNPSAGTFSCWQLDAFGSDTRISNYGPFLLDGQTVPLNSPWEISDVRGF